MQLNESLVKSCATKIIFNTRDVHLNMLVACCKVSINFAVIISRYIQHKSLKIISSKGLAFIFTLVQTEEGTNKN